ncbi:SgrR family transcriptional regulator [Pantoea sp. A4]|uniref:SgrR family transcriptional regulator n=1 Tax=Pantoea sp. A4 TaxID=1225184 RepID=UPI0003812B7F|nr:SgrR family transcriptional regulator [Pantoea sp. A4]
MPSVDHHFQRIYLLFAGNEAQSLRIDDIATAISSSKRNARNVLSKMSERGWLEWVPARGRGKKSTLRFLVTPQKIEQNRLEEYIDDDRDVFPAKRLESSQKRLKELVRENFGTFVTSQGVSIRIPYYRAVDTLTPLSPRRRTERHLIRQCFCGLSRYDAFQAQAVPDLAHYWLSHNGDREWHFFLRKGLHFSDGSAITAAHIKRCLDNARMSLVFREMFTDIREITTEGDLKVIFQLRHPLNHLPELLATIPAKIFKTQNGKLISTGPFSIAEHSDKLLCIRKNRHYHLAAPMIDEVNVYRFDTQDINMSFIPLLRTTQPEAINKPRERKLEQGASFLLIDADGQCAETAWRKFLNDLLQPVDILRRSALKQDYARALSFSSGMLPGWNHREIDYNMTNPAFGLNRPVVLATFRQPELSQLAAGIATLLHEKGIECRVEEFSYLAYMTSSAPNVDLWLTNFMVDFEDVGAYKNWLVVDPTLQRLPYALRHNLDVCIAASAQQPFNTFHQALETCFGSITRGKWIIPLFHHWLDYESDSAFTWRDSNTLGWPDFSQVWIE